MKKTVLYAAAAFSVFILLYLFFVYQELYTPVVTADSVYSVQKGESLRTVVDNLEAAGYTGNSSGVYLYLRVVKRGYIPKAGTFTLKKGYTLNDILTAIGRGVGMLERFTITPGLSIKEIGILLESSGIMSAKKFYEIAQDRQFISRWPLIHKNSLEGFIYPETYDFSKEETPENITAFFVNTFFKQTASVIDYNNITPEELYKKINIASLIEKEAVVDKERPLVSSVIYNRLNIGMHLQFCSTVIYAIGSHRKQLYLRDLEVRSPYNTYIHPGLPPTPISNPSIRSIEAAFRPAETDYLYFVSRGDGTHSFSRTYREHLYFKDQGISGGR